MWALILASRFKVATLALCCILVTGCATPEGQQQAVGAGTGAALGALAGGLIGGNTKSALIGAGVGALLGYGAVKLSQYRSSQVRSVQDDKKLYGYRRVSNPVVKIRNATSAPSQIQPGQEITITTDYSVALPSGMDQVPVEESWILKKDGKEVQRLGPQSDTRSAGGYLSGGAIEIPRNMPSGTYVVEHRVLSGSSYDSQESTFVVL